MIEFSHVYKTYPGPVHALSNISVNIDKGEFVFITGPSGAGKTTLFRMISAFDKPTSGGLKVAGRDLTKINSREVPYFRRQIGVVFQDFRLLKEHTVFENVALPLVIRKDPAHIIRRKTEDMLEKVGLQYKHDLFPEQLSGGEQQRVAIARALIHQPDVLIADEPTGNLDQELSREIIDLLDAINAQGTTVIVATHDLDLVKGKGRRNVQIKQGTVSIGGPI